jgi:hypothetical protein
VQPVAPETNSAMGLVGRLMGGSVFGQALSGMPASAQQTVADTMAGNRGMQLLFGGLQDQGQGGEWVDDTSSLIKPYSFDPVTGTFTAAPRPKVYRAYSAPATTTPFGYDYGGGFGGDSAGASSSGATGGGGGMSNSGEGGGSPGEGGWAQGGIASLAQGGQSHLGDYSDGGRLLRGPGDGVSDSIPASIGDKRPARLADGEFVVSADVVSGLGNGSTEAGARKLYAMMDRVRKARTGTKKMGKTVNPDKLIPV